MVLGRLEQLVKATHFVTVPFQLPDRVVKLAYDTVSKWHENKGGDRFTLAQHSGIGFGSGVCAMGVVYPFYGHPSAGLLCLFGLYCGSSTWFMASGLREYASEKGIEETLDLIYERVLGLSRIARFPLLLLSSYVATLEVKEPFAELPAFSLFALASYCYFIDGNTSGYEKTKDVARNALGVIRSLWHKRAQQPSPV